MLMHQIVKGPQIHFWVSEKTVSDAELQESGCPEGKGMDCPTDPQSDKAEKGQSPTHYSHVEIF